MSSYSVCIYRQNNPADFPIAVVVSTRGKPVKIRKLPRYRGNSLMVEKVSIAALICALSVSSVSAKEFQDHNKMMDHGDGHLMDMDGGMVMGQNTDTSGWLRHDCRNQRNHRSRRPQIFGKISRHHVRV